MVLCCAAVHTIGLGRFPVGAVGCEAAVNVSSSGLEVAAEAIVEYEYKLVDVLKAHGDALGRVTVTITVPRRASLGRMKATTVKLSLNSGRQ